MNILTQIVLGVVSEKKNSNNFCNLKRDALRVIVPILLFLFALLFFFPFIFSQVTKKNSNSSEKIFLIKSIFHK